MLHPSVLIAVCIGVTAKGVIIDDFRAGAAWLQAENIAPGSTEVQSSLNPIHVLGAARRTHVGSGSGLVTLEITPAQGILSLSGTRGEFNVGYGFESDLNLDLLAEGDTAFRITYLSSMHDGYSIQLESRSQGSTQYAWSFVQFSSPLGGGEAIIPFSRFSGVDLKSVDRITISGARIGGTIPMRISRIETVPEPSVGVAAVIGSVAAMRRRRPTVSRMTWLPS
jgi:hypothetical protein